MTRPVKAVVDCSTNTTELIELTDEEIAQMETDAQVYTEQKAQEEAEAKAKAELKASALAKLAELGLTEDEAKVIAG